MRRGDRQVAEERAVLVVADEFQGFFHDRVVRVRLALASADVPGQRDLLAIANQVRWVKRVGVDLVVVPEKNVEPMPFRHTGRPTSARAPLAETTGGIAPLFQHGGHRRLVGAERCYAVVGTDGGVAHVLARHQRGPQRSTHGCRRQGLGESDPLGRHSVDPRRVNLRIPHVRQLVVRQLVRHHVHDVWPVAGEDPRGQQDHAQ